MRITRNTVDTIFMMRKFVADGAHCGLCHSLRLLLLKLMLSRINGSFFFCSHLSPLGFALVGSPFFLAPSFFFFFFFI